MMRIRFDVLVLVALFAGCLATATAFADCGKGQPVFEDTFQTLDPSWGGADDTLSVANGALVIKPKPGYMRWDLSQSDYYGDGSICVLATIAEASDIGSAQALVAFWATDYNNSYILNIGSDGKKGFYKVDRMSNNRWLTPIDWTTDPAIKFQLGDTNAVEIQMAGRTASILINGKKMNQFNGSPPDGGGLIGLGGSTGENVTAKFVFQKFQFFKAAAP
jgi:hypothetical protein